MSVELFGDPNGPYYQDGPAVFDYIMMTCLLPPTTIELRDMKKVFFAVTIVKDIGVSENSIKDLLTKLRHLNSEIPAANRFTDPQQRPPCTIPPHQALAVRAASHWRHRSRRRRPAVYG